MLFLYADNIIFENLNHSTMLLHNFIVKQDVLASKGQRFINHLIDIVPQYGIMYGLAYGFFYLGEFTGYFGLSDFWEGLSVIQDYIFSYALLVIYYYIFESLTHRTLGKYATNTKVIMITGENPTNKAILLRSLCRLIPFDALSFLGTNGKGWHDSLSNTYVVDVAKFEAIKTTELELDQIGVPFE
jgi:uncharacterized RDD family membrane protein YckC